MSAVAPVVDDPELWQPGDVKEIPTVLGLAYLCTITRELYAELTGRAS